MEDVRLLGARLTFVDNEWLPSMFRRIGHTFSTSAEDITNWCGLYDLRPADRARLGNRLTKQAVAGITAGLGFTASHLQTTVMGNLPDELMSLREDGTTVQSKDWSRGDGTRYCVECLREQPGVFYTHWRLWWSFICERHHTTLRGGCPSCHQEIVEAAVTEREPRDPLLCWATLPDGDYCRHSLVDSWDEPPVATTSPMLHAQLTLARAWAAEQANLPKVHANTLRGAGIALLGAGNLERIAELARVSVDEIRGLFDQRDRTGGTPPREPLAMAALMGAAYRLITDPERDVRAAIRETTFIRPVRSADVVEGPGSARYLLSYWPGIDERMRGRVVRALDRDLPPIQRLVHGSAASAEVFEALEELRDALSADDRPYSPMDEARGRSPRTFFERWRDGIPSLMWPSWAAPLGVDERTEAFTLQLALADALRIAGTGAHPDAEAIAGIGKRLRPSMLGTPGQTDSVLRQLCELAIVLHAEPPPIDYKRRMSLPANQLLSEEHWNVLTESVGESSGKQRRLLNARRYAYLRMSACAPRDLPEPLRFRSSTPDVAEYTMFLLTMSAELKVVIDEYLVGWLARFERVSFFGIADFGLPRTANGQIVVAYEPPRFRHPGAHLAPELDDIDLAALHELIGNGVVGLGHLAEAVDRAPRHVRWAIAAHPVPFGRLISPVDWTAELADTPDQPQTWLPRDYWPEPVPEPFDFSGWDL